MAIRNLADWMFPKPRTFRRTNAAHRFGSDWSLRLGQLEERVTPATNSWIGGNALWSADANWSLGHAPVAGEDVVISNGATVTHNANSDTVLSISISGGSTLNLTGGSITDATTLSAPAATADFKLMGGTLIGATVPAGSEITATTSGGTLSGVTLGGTLDLTAASGAYSYVTNGLTLSNGTINIGSVGASPRYGYLYFYNSGDQTLGGAGVVNFGDSTNNSISFYSSYSFNKLTIDSGITVQGANGLINSNSGTGLETRGTITSDPTTVGSALANTIITVGASGAGAWRNQGTLQALNGGALTTSGAWSNTGLITETNSTINLAGTFPSASVGGLTRTGGAVNLTGTMINDGGTFAFNASTGSWNLRGGNVQGGTIRAANGAALVATISGGTLIGVTLDGGGGDASPLDLSVSAASGSYAYITGGLTLNNATVNLGSVGAGAKYGYLYFYNAGDQTLGGAGVINFGDSPNNGVYFYSSYTLNKLTVEPGITIQGANGSVTSSSGNGLDFRGTITSDPTIVGSALANTIINVGTSGVGLWRNQGALQALNGGTLTTAGTWSSTGSITETNSTINLGGTFPSTSVGGLTRTGGAVNVTGTMINDGGTFAFNASTGSWNLRGGNVQGGTIKAAGGVALVGTTSGGTLTGVTLDGGGGNASPLDLSASAVSGSFAYIAGGLTLNNATVNLGSVGANPKYGYLYFYYAGDQTLGGAGVINFGDSASNGIFSNGYYSFDRLTIAPGITIQGANGTISGNTSFKFQGTITSDPATVGSALTNTTITISPSGDDWRNTGTIQARNTGRILAQGPNSNFAAGTLTGGTWKVSANGILRLVNSGITTNAATIVLDGPNSNFYSDTGTTNALSNLATNAAAGSFSIQNGRNFTTAGAFGNAGSLTIGSGSALTLPGANNYTQTGGSTTVNGSLATGGIADIQGGALLGGGTIAASVTSAGSIFPGSSPGTLTVNGNFTQTAAGVLNIEMGGAAPGAGFDQLVVNGIVTLDGTLRVTRLGGFAPQQGDVYRILDKTTAGAVLGQLGPAEGATFVADGYTFVISYAGGTGNDVILTAINVAPTLDPISDPPAILEDSTEQTINLTGISSGAGETQTLKVTAISSNPGLIPNPTVTYASPDSTGVIHYTPVANQNGTAVITVTVDDGAGGTHTVQQSFTVRVNAVNDAPSFAKGPDQQTLEDAGLQSVPGWAGSIGAGPADESGQNLTFLVSTNNDSLFSVLPAISASGNLTYTPAANMNGTATVTVRLQDDGGTANGGTDTSAAQTFTISVTAVNDAPSFVKGADQSVPEGSGARTVSGWATNISAGPANESGQNLSFVLSTDNNALFAVPPAVDAGGNLTYTPAANASGGATVTVELRDDGGTANGGVDRSSQTFNLIITPVNHRPVLDPLDTRMLPPIPVRGAILSSGGRISDLTKNISDPDPGTLKGVAITQVDTSKGTWQFNLPGDQTSWTTISGVSNMHALLLADDGNTLIRFVPNAGFTGFASLTFKGWDRSNSAAEGTFDDSTDAADTSYSLLDDRAWIAVGATKPTVDPDGRTVLAPVLPVYAPTSKVTALQPFPVRDMLGIAGLEQGMTATLGAAIIAADSTGGKWQYQLAQTKNWLDVGAVSANNALLLRPTDMLRYLPTLGANGPAPLTFKAWESVGPTSPNYGNFTGTAVLDLTPILDLSVPATLNPINAGQTTTGAAFSTMMSASRVVGSNIGVAIVASAGTGTWEYRPVGGQWTPVGTVSATKALFLNPADEIRFRAGATASPHTASLSFKAWDKTKFAPGSRGAATGSIVSVETEILTVAVGNTRPTLNTAPTVTVPLAGTIVKTMLGSAVTDTAGSLEGIAIVAADNSGGKWQYLSGGATWLDVGTVSAGSAVLLTDTSKLRFVPNPGFKGAATIQYKAWDRTAGQPGDRIDTNSGLNSFSLEIETATVTVP